MIRYPGWSPYNYTLNNTLRYIDPNGMYSAETMDLILRMMIPEKRRKKKIKDILEIASDVVDKVTKKIKRSAQNAFINLYEFVFVQGPPALNSASSEIFIAGALGGGALSLAGHPEIGVPLIGFSAGISGWMGGSVAIISGIDWSVNGKGSFSNVANTLINAGLNKASGNMWLKVGERLGEVSKSIDWILKSSRFEF